MLLILLLAAGLPADDARLSSSEQVPSVSTPSLIQIFRAPDWSGAVEVGDEGCIASTGEYTLWVYASATKCGVPRQQAERVVVIRQPLPGVAPIRAAARLPEGRYMAWVYGAGDPGHPWLRLCAKGCVVGELPTTPAWVSLGWIEIRDNQTLLLRSWQQPEAHTLHIQAMVLSSNEARPDWTP
jgi:hypothetical protein